MCSSPQLVLASSPILLPTLLGLIVYRLNKDSRSSRARIRLLESDETYENALAKVFVNLERRIEDAVVDVMEDPGSGLVTPVGGELELRKAGSDPDLVRVASDPELVRVASDPELVTARKGLESPELVSAPDSPSLTGVATPVSDAGTMAKPHSPTATKSAPVTSAGTPATGSETTLATSAASTSASSDVISMSSDDDDDNEEDEHSVTSSRKSRKLRDRLKACREKHHAKKVARLERRSSSLPPSSPSASTHASSLHSKHSHSHKQKHPAKDKDLPHPEPSPLQRTTSALLDAPAQYPIGFPLDLRIPPRTGPIEKCAILIGPGTCCSACSA